VLQSAEVMKAAVGRLEPFMEKSASATRGRVMLATVKGDVHDIGKNLVDIVLSNNGFEVVNLGIKVPSEQLIQAAREHQPDVIGLSGLLVKSAQQMVVAAGDLRAAGIASPLLVGGAALSRRFTHRRIAPAYEGVCTYARDAMHGLELVGRLTSEEEAPLVAAEVSAMVEQDNAAAEAQGAKPIVAPTLVAAVPLGEVAAPQPPDLDRHTESFDLDEVWDLVNPRMLYGKHLGLKGSLDALRREDDERLAKLEAVVEEVKSVARDGVMSAAGVWRFFRAQAEGDRLVLVENEAEVGGWNLPRQRGRDGLCITDYIVPEDHVALFVTTAAGRVREQALEWKEEGEYLKSHTLAALALETAEAGAEWLHRRLRDLWGFADGPDLTPRDLFGARYRGKRYSFGYPACPDLAGQRQLFELLEPEEIGVTLTEGDMMDPEASVSALVVHHPEARYFSVG
jgi:5-methyltetrahydrofolate--homocysteine methyltransferase